MDGYDTALSFLCIMSLLILISHTCRNEDDRYTQYRKEFSITYYVLIVAILMEWLGIWFNGKSTAQGEFLALIKCIEYCFAPVLPVLLSKPMADKRQLNVMYGILLGNVLLEVSSLVTGFVYYIDEENVYRHGPFYFLYVAFILVGLAFFGYSLTLYSRKYRLSNKRTLGMLIALVVITLTIHLVYPAVYLDYVGVTLAVILFSIYFDDFLKQNYYEQNTRQLHMIQALSSDYESVYHVDVEQNVVTPIRLSQIIEEKFGEFLRSGVTYEVAFGGYVNSEVLQDDREQLLEECSMVNILKKLENSMLYEREYRVSRAGKIRYFNMRVVRIDEPSESRKVKELIMGFADVDEQKARWEQMVMLSETDQLTGLKNRRAYEKEADRLAGMSNASAYKIAIFDLNDLKQINDQCGHGMGDKAIVAVAECLQQVFRANGNVYRMGGDEFVLITDVSEKHLLEALADFGRLIQKWDMPQMQPFSVSYGYACILGQGRGAITAALKEADTNMYQMKKAYHSSKLEGSRMQ